jgi:hypothetical protein
LLYTGAIAGSVLCFAFAGFIIFTCGLFDRHLLKSYRKWKESRRLESEIYNVWKRIGIAGLFIVNFIVMALIDVVYVGVYINGDNTSIFFAQVFIAIFKLFWNEVFLWKAMRMVHMWARKNDESVEKKDINSPVSSTTDNKAVPIDQINYVPSTKDTIFFVVVNAVNNIIVPSLAIAAVDPNCFYNMFIAAPSVQSTYSYSSCIVYNGQVVDTECSIYSVSEQDISYSPPFVYGYQCSSYLAINYIPVHVISFVIIGIILPSIKLWMKLFYDSLDGLEKSDHHRLLHYMLPNHLKELSPHPLPNQTTLFQKHRMVVQINAAFMILLSFGILFPPLAIIICISIANITLFEELMIGKLLYEAKKLGFKWYHAQLEAECDNVANGFHITIWIALVLCSLMCGYLVFDTFGDALGWKIGIGPGIGLSCVPLLIYVWSLFVKKFEGTYEVEGREQSFFEMLPPTMFRFLGRESIMVDRLTKVDRDASFIQVELSSKATKVVVQNPLMTAKDENDLL